MAEWLIHLIWSHLRAWRSCRGVRDTELQNATPCVPPSDQRSLGRLSAVAVVTGASSGVGAACAKFLAQTGYRVIMACRDMKAGESVAADIQHGFPRFDVEVVHLDLCALQSIDAFVKHVQTIVAENAEQKDYKFGGYIFRLIEDHELVGHLSKESRTTISTVGTSQSIAGHQLGGHHSKH
ncbi:hypothetical protein CYMTET_13289 [Cymbomonas tetramitiformis]|uniref:Uncharacterized protein n=1 Tax=Cymbomonas tetramitiformis TaxID=36881 RepID=A0AAE0GJY1_9CHLO|nr:hypothetical protein CYMTET_13289 [Cymbomonas tetramitiformis]